MNFIWKELEFFLTCLKNLNISESFSLNKNKGFCVSTGCSFESWVFYPERLNSDIIKEIIKFFNERDISFIFPVYNINGEYEYEKIFEDSGLFYGGDLTAMSFEPDVGVLHRTNSQITFKKITSENSREWAETAWRGFGSSDNVAENYYKFVDALSNASEKLSLYIAEYDKKNSGTFLITHEEKYVGVYYFATLPEMRRKGIANAMMNEICRLSGNKKILLQATPAGVPFYKNFGFEELFKIPVYSNENEVF